MKTYFTLALSNNYSCIGGILKAKDFSIKCGNLLERDFLDHTYKVTCVLSFDKNVFRYIFLIQGMDRKPPSRTNRFLERSL